MEGFIKNYRLGRHTQTPSHIIIIVDGVAARDDAKKLIGKGVSWKTPAKEPKIIRGKVASAHGNSGAIRAIFERGLPGQALGTVVQFE